MAAGFTLELIRSCPFNISRSTLRCRDAGGAKQPAQRGLCQAESATKEPQLHFNVLIVGAGLSGICAGYYVKEHGGGRSFAILEGRESLGGTWDLFRYPGIRSDSDMHTLGFSFNPWPNPQAIADGPSILKYLHDTSEEYGLDAHIRYQQMVETISWSSEDRLWTVTSKNRESSETTVYTCDVIWACTGYYRYDRGHMPDYPGASKFKGQIVHPQFWTDDIDYEDKNVVVIGSGATAVTLVPAMAGKAAHVTMLQRSPSYVLSVPEEDAISEVLKKATGKTVGSALTRWKNVGRLMFFFQFSRRFPEAARNYLLKEVEAKIGDVVDVGEHFSPTYAPWDQRLCFVPDDDLFDALRSGEASVVTDTIKSFDATGIELDSGKHLNADIIVSATGLDLVVAGGAKIVVDGEELNVGEETMYKGAMLSNLPNAILSVGYTNASWTLKCELISQYAVRLLSYMDDHDYQVFTPRLAPGEQTDQPLIDFNSGYIQRAADRLPKQGRRLPWRLYQNYVLDTALFRHFPIEDDALHFE